MKGHSNLNQLNTKLTYDIIKTLSLFASFNKTGGSVLKILDNLVCSNEKYFFKPSLLEILDSLIFLKKKGLIEEKYGQYYLKFLGHKGRLLVEEIKNTDYKLSKLTYYVKLFKFIPFIKAILLTGSVAVGCARENSDIDLLIICRRNTLWLVRIYMTIFFDILAIRRKGKNIQDKLCLNHFIDEDNLEIKDKSIYSAFNYKNSIPIYVRDRKIWLRFLLKNSGWIGKIFYEPKSSLINEPLFYEQSLITKIIELVVSLFLWRPIYWFIKNIQIAIIKKNPLTYFKNSRIIYNDREIIFHPLPRALKINKAFEFFFQKACNLLK